MDFSPNKTPIEIIKEGAMGSGNGEWYKKSWKEFDQLKNIVQKYYCSDYYVSVNKYGVKCGTSPRFWENKGWNKQILMAGFSGILGTGQVGDQKMMKGKLIGGKNCNQVQR